MKSEWGNWVGFEAAEPIDPKDVPPGVKVIGTRWVHTDKNQRQRQAGKKVPELAKSRIVVQGHQERNEIRADAPTASVLAVNLLCSVAASSKWKIEMADASNAYLQSDGISRLLILRPPDPLPDPALAGMYLRAKGTIYGTRDAGRGWWLKLKRVLTEAGWRPHPLEPAFFTFHAKDGSLQGLMTSHVDDLLYCGDGTEYRASLDKIIAEIKLKIKTESFVYCGKLIAQDEDYTIKINQADAANALEFIHLDRERRRHLDLKLTPEEKSDLRRVVGSLQWLARQSRSDLAAHASLVAQTIGDPRIADAVEANRAVKAAHERSGTGLVFRSDVNIDYHNGVIFCCSDASFANVPEPGSTEKIKSQSGHIIGIGTNPQRTFHPLEVVSAQIRRVCRSTLAAEANSLLEAAESADYIRFVIAATFHRDLPLNEMDGNELLLPVMWYTDAKSLYDVVTRDTSMAADKRLRLILAQLRELIAQPGVRMEWVDTQLMLADALTKLECERDYLVQAIADNAWDTTPTPVTLAAKQAIRAARQARNAAKQRAKTASQNTTQDGQPLTTASTQHNEA